MEIGSLFLGKINNMGLWRLFEYLNIFRLDRYLKNKENRTLIKNMNYLSIWLADAESSKNVKKRYIFNKFAKKNLKKIKGFRLHIQIKQIKNQ